MDKLFFSIGEAAQTIGESTSLVRYWTNEFDRYFKVRRSSRGDRKYTAEDIETLKQIHYLVNVKGMTLEGVDKALKENKGSVDRSVKVLESLKNIRDQLTEVKKAL